MKIKKYIKKFPILKNLVLGDVNKNTKDGVFNRAWGYIFTNQIYGDFLEFGVYKGGTLLASYKQYLNFRKWMDNEILSNEKWRVRQIKDFHKCRSSFYGFDSFEGIPDNEESSTMFLEGTYFMSKKNVEKILIKNGIGLDELYLIKSYYSNLKDSQIPSKACMIHIDCDLYESTIQALFLSKKSIQQGTIILFDDYNCFSSCNNKGERKAIREFTEDTGIIFEPWFSYLYVGQAFICHVP